MLTSRGPTSTDSSDVSLVWPTDIRIPVPTRRVAFNGEMILSLVSVLFVILGYVDALLTNKQFRLFVQCRVLGEPQEVHQGELATEIVVQPKMFCSEMWEISWFVLNWLWRFNRLPQGREEHFSEWFPGVVGLDCSTD